jgi:hypothetical protein
VGINSYGGAPSLAERYRRAGVQKPYILTEFGPAGAWEVGKMPWGAPLELTSTQKSLAYATAYRSNVIENSNDCLGSYTFLWGNKVEATPTWFGMFLPDGTRLAAVSTLSALWTAKPASKDLPEVSPIKLNGPDEVSPGITLTASVEAMVPDGSPARLDWSLIKELCIAGQDSNRSAPMDAIDGAVTPGPGQSVTIKMPREPGPYRLMLVARSAQGAATANVPMYVRGQVSADFGVPKTKLPFTVYGAGQPLTFIPSGYMGDVGSLKLDLSSAEDPRSGKTCAKFSFQNASNWGGIAWQYPANDWGEKPQAINLNGAKRLTFWMRGSQGGEKVKIGFGILDKDKPYPDSAGSSGEFQLTAEWKEYSLDTSGKNLGKIKTGFVITVAGNGSPQTIYFDDIKYE